MIVEIVDILKILRKLLKVGFLSNALVVSGKLILVRWVLFDHTTHLFGWNRLNGQNACLKSALETLEWSVGCAWACKWRWQIGVLVTSFCWFWTGFILYIGVLVFFDFQHPFCASRMIRKAF